jgi:hypothetical protein
VSVDLARLRRGLGPASALYLAIPVAIFGLGYLRPGYALLFTAALAASLVLALRGARSGRAAEERCAPAWALLAALLPIALAVAAGALGVAVDYNGDWSQRFEIFDDLVRQPWPPTYSTSAGPLAQVYYTGWFLPAAPPMAWLGWMPGLLALLAWSALGFALVAGWLVVLVRLHPALVGLLFLFFAGIDVWENLLDDGLWNTLREVLEGDKFEWQELFFFHATHDVFIKIPNHAIPAWLLGALALDAADRRDAGFPTALALGVAMLWSPFVALGLAPLLAVPWLCAEGGWRERLRAQFGGANLAGLVVALVVLAYYAARWHAYALPPGFLEGVVPTRNGWLPGLLDVSTGQFVLTAAFFSCVTFLWMALPVLGAERVWRGVSSRAALVIVAMLVLIALLFFRYGFHNDLQHRASLPAQFVLVVLSLDLLGRFRRHPIAAALLAVGLALGVLSATAQMIRTGERVHWLLVRAPVLAERPTGDVFQRQMRYVGSDDGFDRITQYLGAVEAPFFALLARRSEPRSIPDPPSASAAKQGD